MPYNDGTSDAVVTALATATITTTTALTHKCRCETGWLTLNAKHIEKGNGARRQSMERYTYKRCCAGNNANRALLYSDGASDGKHWVGWSDGTSDTLVTVLATATMMALRDGNA